MKSLVAFILWATALCWLAGCVPSLPQPLYWSVVADDNGDVVRANFTDRQTAVDFVIMQYERSEQPFPMSVKVHRGPLLDEKWIE